MKDVTDDELRRLLNENEIELLRNTFLRTLKDMQANEESIAFSAVFEKMGLGVYNLPVAMRIIIQDNLLPQGLIEVTNDKVKITDKGKRRCDQIRQTDETMWQETLKRLSKSFETKEVGSFQSSTRENRRNLFSFKKIIDEITDLTYLDVITTSESEQSLKLGPKELNVSEVLQRPDVTVLARTRIELDGAILVSLPQENGKVKFDNEIIELHKKNLEFHIRLWQQMFETMTKTLKDAADQFTKYVNPIGDEQNIIGNIFEGEFDIDLPSMEIGKRYSFKFRHSLYEAVKNEKGQLELSSFYYDS